MGLLQNKINDLRRPAILLGNGINRCGNTFPKWESLLQNISGVQIKPDWLTNTEIYDFIELRTNKDENLK